MLRRIRIDNFKSLINVLFEPSGLNLIIGPNNSGKTNLCRALEFLACTSRVSLMDAVYWAAGQPWDIVNKYMDKPTIDFECLSEIPIDGGKVTFEYNLIIHAKPQVQFGLPPEFSVQSETLKADGGGFESTVLLENEEGSVRLLHEKRFFQTQDTSASYIETTTPTDSTMLYRLFDLETNKYANAFKKYLSSWVRYDLENSKLRETQAKQYDWILNPNGSNLISVLYNLKNTNERKYRRLIEHVQEIEPRLEIINFFPTEGQVYMQIENSKNKKFSSGSVSNGTLRFLAINYIVLSSSLLTEQVKAPPPLIMIEEPENGIYIRSFKRIFEQIDPSGLSGQYIFTSHSPYFIDLFESCLEGVFVTKFGETHSTIIKPDIQKLKKNLKEAPLGELHFREMLT